MYVDGHEEYDKREERQQHDSDEAEYEMPFSSRYPPVPASSSCTQLSLYVHLRVSLEVQAAACGVLCAGLLGGSGLQILWNVPTVGGRRGRH